jgi:teichuronic acid biosynthesis glycosyltransferase TuaC
MRILFFSNVFPNPGQPTKGPFNRALVEALAGEHDVHVVSPIGWLDEFRARFGRRQSVRFGKVYREGTYSVEYVRFVYPPGILRAWYGECLEWSAAAALDRRIAAFRPDAVVSYWVHPDGEVAVRAARRAGIPAVVMTGGSDVLVYGWHGSRRQKLLRVLHAADAVVTVSRNLADVLESDGIAPEKLHVIHRGVDRQTFSPGNREAARLRLGLPRDRKTIVAVGRLVPVKGFDVLVRAVARLRDLGSPVDCHIIGGGELHAPLTRQIQQLGLTDRVFLHGAARHGELPDWYRATDLTVLSSLSEGIPNVLLESICCGTPFVATDVGGVAEIADERLHRLVPSGDDAALADAIRDRLTENATQHDHSQQPRFVPSSWDDSARKLCEVIRDCRRDAADETVADFETVAADRSRTAPFIDAEARELQEAGV